MADKVKVWFDAEADYLEVRFSDAAGYMKGSMAEFVGLVQVEECRCQFRAFTLGCTCGTRNTASVR